MGIDMLANYKISLSWTTTLSMGGFTWLRKQFVSVQNESQQTEKK